MSYYSYTSYDCTVPDTTVLHGDFGKGYLFPCMACDHDAENGVYKISLDGETRYVDNILDDLISLFQMPLDEVPGLELHCHYETDEDGHWECELDIVDGKCKYAESEIRMVEQPMKDCLIRIRPVKEG